MQMPEIQMVLTGTIFRVNPVFEFGDETKSKIDGAKIAVLSVNGDGATEVKLNKAQFDALRPVPGANLAWIVEAFPWKMENGRAGVSFLYRGDATLEHVSDLHDFVGSLEPAGK